LVGPKQQQHAAASKSFSSPLLSLGFSFSYTLFIAPLVHVLSNQKAHPAAGSFYTVSRSPLLSRSVYLGTVHLIRKFFFPTPQPFPPIPSTLRLKRFYFLQTTYSTHEICLPRQYDTYDLKARDQLHCNPPTTLSNGTHETLSIYRVFFFIFPIQVTDREPKTRPSANSWFSVPTIS